MISQPLTKRQTASFFVFILIYMVTCVTCFALTKRPNNSLRQNRDLTIDCAYIDQGYILAKMDEKTDKKIKMRVKINDEELIYNINPNVEWETIPLQYGNGKYTFQLYKQAKGTRYSQEGSIEINVQMTDPTVALLCSNQYVNFTETTPAVIKATELCKDMDNPKDIYKTIKKYILTNFQYDYIKAYTVPKQGVLPDIDNAWKKKMGICQDLSAITVAMLRSQGVPAKLVIGKYTFNNSTTPHAWVSVILNDKEYRFDPTTELTNTKGGKYTTERIY